MPATLTIEQLAAQSGMSVRNIRAHQARGLLAAPEVRLRVGYYGPEHVTRLRLIRDLQDEGFNLAGIKRLLDDRQGTAERLARFRQALTEPTHVEQPEIITAAALGQRFGVGAQDAHRVLARAQRLGILRAVGDDAYEAPSPSLLAVAEQVVARGVSPAGALAVFEEIERHCDAVSGSFVTLFLEEVWQPFQAAGMPVERWTEIETSIDRLRPLASDALLAIFGQRMSAQIERAFRPRPGSEPVPFATRRSRLRPVSPIDPDEQRSASRGMWEQAAAGWGKRADRVRDWGMPVSVTMVDALALQPGQRVLELAAGPGDTGFMAAELVAPGGTLISSDGADAMVDVARARAEAAGLSNVEFRQLELEWIDMEAASVDAVLCRWGIMLIVDPAAAAREIRRVLRPSGRAAFAVWDRAELNPWATIPGRVLIELGHSEPPDPGAPGMFSLADDGALQELLESTGFGEVTVAPVTVERRYDELERYIEETADMSPLFSCTIKELPGDARDEVLARMRAAAAPFVADDGSVLLPGSSLVAVATA